MNAKLQTLKSRLFAWVKGKLSLYLILLFIGSFCAFLAGILQVIIYDTEGFGFLNDVIEIIMFFPFFSSYLLLPYIIGYGIIKDFNQLGSYNNRFITGMLVASAILKLLAIPLSFYLLAGFVAWSANNIGYYEDRVDNFEDLFLFIPNWLRLLAGWLSIYFASNFIYFLLKLYILAAKKNDV